MTPTPPTQTPSDTPELALARYFATVNTRAEHKRELRRQIEDAKIKAARRPFWWLKD